MAKPDIGRTIRAYISSTSQIRSKMEGVISRYWDSLGGYRDEDLDRLVSKVVPIVLGSQKQISSITNAYIARVAGEALGQRESRPSGVSEKETTGKALRGVEPEEVYRRPVETVWAALSGGAALPDAASQGRNRLLSLANTDLQLARNKASFLTISGDGRVSGYRRILTGDENCALCTIASTQRYHKEDLMPIHPGCDCTVGPIFGDQDPGQVIDPELLERTHEQVEGLAGTADYGGRAPDYRDIRVRQHGEYGPTLTWRNQGFTGPDDLKN